MLRTLAPINIGAGMMSVSFPGVHDFDAARVQMTLSTGRSARTRRLGRQERVGRDRVHVKNARSGMKVASLQGDR